MDADDDVVAQVSDRFDGLVLFTRTVFSPKHAARLDCHYAALGISKEPDGYEIEPLSNAMLGEAGGGLRFRGPMVEIPDAEEEESPAVEKYRQTMTLVMALMLVAAVIWYLIKG